MKKRIIGIALVFTFLLICVNFTSFAYSHILEDINFNSFISDDFSLESTGAKYGSFSHYQDGYPTGGFYSFTADSLDRDGNGKSLKVRRTQQYNNNAIPGVKYTSEAPLTGVVYLETSIYVPSTENTLYSPRGITFITSADNTAKTLLQMTEAGGRFYLWDGSKVQLTSAADPTWTSDTWYDIKIWYDLDNNDIKYYVIDEDNNVVIDKSYNGTVNESFKAGISGFGFVNAWSFKKLYTEINTNKNDYSTVDETHFDNIRIETLEILPGSASADYIEDFEDFTAPDVQWGLPAKPAGADWNYYQYVGAGTVDGFCAATTDKGTSLKFVTGTETDKHARLDVRYGTSLSDNAGFKDAVSGKFSVQVPDNNVAKVFALITDKNTQINVALFYDDGYLHMFGNKLCKYKFNTWYDISYSYDASSGDYYYRVIENENEYVGTGVFEQAGGTPQTIWKLIIQQNNKAVKKDTYIIIDDFMMKSSMNATANFRINKDISVNNTQILINHDAYVRFTKKLNETSESLAAKVTSYYQNTQIEEVELIDEYTAKIVFDKELGENYRIDFNNVVDVQGNTLSDFIELSTKLPEYVKPVVKFEDAEGNEIKSLVNGESVSANLSLQTGSDTSKDAFAYMALYDENKNLCAIDFNTTSFTPQGNSESLSLNVPANGAYNVKLAVWKADFTPVVSSGISTPVVIIKLDDLRAYSASHFVEMKNWAETNDVKIGVGIITNTLEGASTSYINSVKEINNSPNVEIWCHGYTHSYTYEDNVLTYSEFTDSVENQSQTLKNCADILLEKCGIIVRSLGTPGNYSNENTIKALEANPQYTTLIASASVGTELEGISYKHLTNWMSMESAVDVVKTLDSLKSNYETRAKDASYVLVAGHSYGWDETSEETFNAFINWLKDRNVTFMTPTEYYNFVA